MADPRFCRQVVAVASAFAVAGWPASAQDLDRYERYRQTPAILAHYPDVPLKLEAPSLAAARQSFTSQQELDDFLAVLARRSPRVVAGSLGKSQQGRDIPYLVATAEGFFRACRDQGARPADCLACRAPARQRAGRRRRDT